jgi:release factor glutamine methyltransferase
MASVYTALIHARGVLTTISQTPRLEAEALLTHVLNQERSHLYAHPEVRLTGRQNQDYEKLVARRAMGEPLAYIVGVKEFWSLPLRVSPDVLIPRPETELLVELALARIPVDEPQKIADLGTGSGAIALALASERPHCDITATDFSETALRVAADNARRLGLTNSQFIVGDWFAPLRARFHVIVSNPPYVALDDPDLQDALLQFEPHAALISEAQGHQDIETIVRSAGSFLHPDGWLLLEHGCDQGDQVRVLFMRYGLREVKTICDLAGHERVTLGQRMRSCHVSSKLLDVRSE